MSEEKLNKIIEMVGSIDSSVSRLNTSVLGDKDAGVSGLAHRVGSLEDEVEDVRTDLTSRLSWLKGGAWLASIAIGFLAFFKDHIKFS